MTATAARRPAEPPKSRAKQIIIGLLFLLFLAVFYPPALRYSVYQLARLGAWRHDAKISIGEVSGSVFAPIGFHRVKLTSKQDAVVRIEVKIEHARASFSIVNLFRREPWLRELSVDGVEGEFVVQPENGATTNDASSSRPDSSPLRWLVPAKLDARRVDFLFRRKDESVQFKGISFVASQAEPRLLLIREIEVREPWLHKTFRHIRGTVSVQDETATVSDTTLEPGLILESASADLNELAAGRVEMDFNFRGFGGAIRGEVKSNVQSRESLALDGSGSFSQISIAQLAAFLGSEEVAGGVVREGKFSFHGSPRNWERATFSTRLEASDFLWGKRQWNAFSLGATLSGGRIQIPDLQLRQAHNTITLNGEIDVPSAGTQWWQRDFTCNVAAKIDNLTELSALLGPQLGEMAGKLVIDGSVRGSRSSFSGQLIVSGSHLFYRSAPLDVLNAAIKLDGNELQISHLEFTHGEDYLRGQGVVNILGEEKRYWGEVRASVRDLALYSAFLQPPVAPQSFAGGLFLDWSGDGTARAHSGAFRGRVNDLRPLGKSSPPFAPLDVEVAGSYSPEAMFFEQCRIAADETEFTATVTANPDSLHLAAIRLQHKNTTWMEGDALLPLNVWTAWQKPGAGEAWNAEVPGKVNLTVRNLQLQPALRLTGRQWPVKGILQGNIGAEGTLSAPELSGNLVLTKGEFAMEGTTISNADADAAFAHRTVKIGKLTARAGGGDVKVSGEIDVRDLNNPALSLMTEIRGLAFAAARDLGLKADADLKLSGPAHAPFVTGSLKNVNAIAFRELTVDDILNPLLADGPLLALSLSAAPFDHWNFDVRLNGEVALKLNGTTKNVRADLRITGPGAAMTPSGTISFSGITAVSPVAPLAIPDGMLLFSSGHPPFVSLRGTATVSGTPIDAAVFGSWPNTTTWIETAPPLPQEAARRLLTTGSRSVEISGDKAVALENFGVPANQPDRLLALPADEVLDSQRAELK